MNPIQKIKNIPDLSYHTISNSRDIIVWVDSEGTLIYVNNIVHDKLGFKPEEVIGKKIYDLNPNEDSAYWENRWTRIKKEKHFVFEKHQKAKDGSIIPF